MAKALNLTGQEFNINSNALRNKRVMLFTDGYENQGGDPVHEAKVLKDDYGKPFCFGHSLHTLVCIFKDRHSYLLRVFSLLQIKDSTLKNLVALQ